MSRLRKAIDHETGEVYHIETTRQAKRRYQKNSAVTPKPTVGQLNAADIWNKQEEKIKKDRERDERRKKAKLKQEAKESKQREIQEQLLREGRIQVEDTWGKVNASQNRLHMFFGVPKMSARTIGHTTEGNTTDKTHQQEHVNVFTADIQVSNAQQPSDPLNGLDKIFTNSPLSQSPKIAENQEESSFVTEATLLLYNDETFSPLPLKNSSKRKRSFDSQNLMPPPKRPQIWSSASQQSYENFDNLQSTTLHQAQSLGVSRSPLQEMTKAQAKLRADEKSSPSTKHHTNHGRHLVATQVVQDILSGLCSQDLEDDFADETDKENKTFTASSFEQQSDVLQRSDVLQQNIRVTTNSHELEDRFEDSGFEEYDDVGIDDESLLTLAATQRLKQDMFASSKQRKQGEDKETDLDWVFSPVSFTEHLHSSPTSPKLSDSFNTDGINDCDLLQRLEDFENGNHPSLDQTRHFNGDGHIDRSSESIFPRKRRVLPWVKNPISYSFGSMADESEDLVPSLASQSLDD